MLSDKIDVEALINELDQASTCAASPELGYPTWEYIENLLNKSVIALGRLQTKNAATEEIKQLRKERDQWRTISESAAETIEELRAQVEQIKDLRDTLQNGVKYDMKDNRYVLCWTERQLDEAKREADEIYNSIRWDFNEAARSK